MVRPLIELERVAHRYPGGHEALRDCSLAIRPGQRHALLGTNGAGKTTLLQHLNGLLRPTQGRLLWHGQAVDYRRAGLLELRQRVGLVFQNPERQLFCAQVDEDVSFGPLNLGLDEATVRVRVAQALAAVGLQAHARSAVHHLSFGQKKRVCIAGVLAMAPELLVLDEPMAGLDPEAQASLSALLDGLAEQGVTVLLSTHDVDFAYRWADELHLMAAGRCIASGPAPWLAQQAQTWREAGLPVPSVLALHQILVARGVLPLQPAPRGLDALLEGLRGDLAFSPTKGLHT